MKTIHNWNAWIGTDEAGKGDYFGPLVVAAVYVDRDCREIFSDLGITDGKTLSNHRIRDLAELMLHQYERHIVVVERMPTEYNSLYTNLRRRGQNLNHLLASLHAEAIHTLATRIGAKHALVDRFSKDDLITQQLHQRVNGEPRLQHLTSRAPLGDKADSKSRTRHCCCCRLYYCSCRFLEWDFPEFEVAGRTVRGGANGALGTALWLRPESRGKPGP